MRNPTPEEVMKAHMDVTGADGVEVLTDKARGVIWINVNGICMLRICQIEELVVKDVRQS